MKRESKQQKVRKLKKNQILLKCLYSKKWKWGNKQINFLGRYLVTNINQDHVNHLKTPRIFKEIEAVIRIFPFNKSQGPDNFSSELHQTFKEDLIAILFTLFHKIEMEGTLPNSFYEATATLILKPQKNTAIKRTTQ